MHGYFVLATAAARVFSFRSSTKQRGLVIALSLAASLVGSSALAQTAMGLSQNATFQMRLLKEELRGSPIRSQNSEAAGSNEQRFRSVTPALAQTASLPSAKRDSADEIAKNRTQKEIDPFAKFENLREKGMWLNIPGPADTIDHDKGGVRSALAEVGIGYVGGTVISLVDNQLPNAASATTANQLYMGQNSTFSTVNFMIVTYDLSRFGIPDGQIVVGAEQQYWTWKPGGPDRVGLNTLAYYQTFFDRKLELKMGYLRNVNEFAGTLVGGNAGASVLAPSSNILYQAGMSNNAAPTPALNVKYNFDDHLYDKVSIQRSISPDGQYAQITENPTGLSWSTANAGILLLDEIGYKNKAAPGLPETWLRAGAGFNNSTYKNLQYPQQSRADANSVYYVAADRQLWQSDVQGSAYRGIYGGFSVMYECTLHLT
ncbi:carbohydrate porin [Bradyrhizobium sp. sGM-13]|uniref:carbohydrate porin n=1 Tax=Bradyrhizobium sp. sGM-13 TaxID=2831781 RepID=UPI0020C0461D|nr:carbohydrate porin [Bradyrhizobium sp. sGM-13]